MKERLILKNVMIFDGIHPDLIYGKDLIIEKGKIKEIVESTLEYENAKVIDLEGYTLSPGFIDCHMHMMLEEISPDKEKSLTTLTPGGELYANADGAFAYKSVGDCKKMLEAGFTTVMDGGGRNFIECALKEAIEKEVIIGPDYYIAGKQLTANPAHFVGFSIEPFGPYGMRKAVRDLVGWGVDFLKIQMSPPIRIMGRKSDAVDFTFEEVQAAIEEAHNYGMKVHAHLRGPQAIKEFLRAGGDYVVHGTGIDEEGIELMLKYNKILLPTLLSPSPYPSPELLNQKPKPVIDMLAKIADTQWECTKKAWQAGIKIAFSSDMGTLGNHIGKNSLEFLNLQKIGLTPFEALKTATSVAADVVGKANEIGQIKPGYQANIVAIKGNPLEDLNAVFQVGLTIKKGKILFNGLEN